MTDVFVVMQDGQRYEGDLETMKRSIEHLIGWKVARGSGIIITDASQELVDFLLDLQKQYPPKLS